MQEKIISIRINLVRPLCRNDEPVKSTSFPNGGALFGKGFGAFQLVFA